MADLNEVKCSVCGKAHPRTHSFSQYNKNFCGQKCRRKYQAGLDLLVSPEKDKPTLNYNCGGGGGAAAH
jgi:hypothetical protein